MTLALLVAGMLWLLRPQERVPIAIVPVVNLTGYAELDPLRLALSHALADALVDSRTVRVIGHEQLLSVLRRFRAQGKDMASGEALQAVREHTGASVLAVMSIVNDGAGFKGRLEFRDNRGLATDKVARHPARSLPS